MPLCQRTLPRLLLLLLPQRLLPWCLRSRQATNLLLRNSRLSWMQSGLRTQTRSRPCTQKPMIEPAAGMLECLQPWSTSAGSQGKPRK